MENSNFQNEVQKQFFDYLTANNKNEIIKYFREIEYKPWEFLDEVGNTGIIFNNFKQSSRVHLWI